MTTFTVTGDWTAQGTVQGDVMFYPRPASAGEAVAAQIVDGVLNASLPVISGSYLVAFNGVTLNGALGTIESFMFPSPSGGSLDLNTIASPPPNVVLGQPTYALRELDVTPLGAEFLETKTALAARQLVSAAPYNIPDIVNRSVPRATPELWAVFADHADGSAPAAFDSGQAATTTLGATGSVAPTISGGVLTATPASGSQTAYYLQGRCADVVTRIGCRFVLKPNPVSGATTNCGPIIGICNTEVTNVGGVETIPDISFHLSVVSPTSWSAAVWAGPNNGNTGLTIIAEGPFAAPLAVDGETEYEMQAWIVGDTATFDLPDGSRHSVTDSRISDATYTGPYVFFEQWSQDPATDNTAGFTHVWASSGYSKPGAEAFTGWRQAEAVTAESSTPVTAYTATAVPGLSPTFTAPPSGAVCVRLSTFLDLPSASDVFLVISYNDNETETSNSIWQQVAATLAGNRSVAADFVLTGLTPWHSVTLTPQVVTSQAATIDLDPAASNYKNALIIVEPIF